MIELYNTTSQPINIGGWFVSDSSSDLTEYQIAAGHGHRGQRLLRLDRRLQLRPVGHERSGPPGALRLGPRRRHRLPLEQLRRPGRRLSRAADRSPACPPAIRIRPVHQVGWGHQFYPVANAQFGTLSGTRFVFRRRQQHPLRLAAGDRRDHVQSLPADRGGGRRRLRRQRLRVRRALQPVEFPRLAQRLLRCGRHRLHPGLDCRRPARRVRDAGIGGDRHLVGTPVWHQAPTPSTPT